MLSLQRRVLALGLLVGASLLVAVQVMFRPLRGEGLGLFYGERVNIGVLGVENGESAISSSSPNTIATLTSATTTPSPTPLSKALVVASLQRDDTSWVTNNFPDWTHYIYTVDSPNATYRVSRNKGHEASVYLTYIIDHYTSLPDLTVFLHSHQTHKHGTRAEFTGIDYDNLAALKALKIEHAWREGYANLRCRTKPGCPAEIQPFRPAAEHDVLRPQELAMADAWKELFGQDQEVPSIIAAPCCAQFGVSRETVLKRGKEEYERYLKWVYDTELDDFTSGRVFEYLWHVVFGRGAVHCPDADVCYRRLYGVSEEEVHGVQGNGTGAT